MPLALGDEHEVAGLERHRLAVREVLSRALEHEEVLLRVRVAVHLVRAVGRELGDVEHGGLGAAVVAVREPVHVHALPARPRRDRGVLGGLGAGCLVHATYARTAMKLPCRAVLFDLDGVLVESRASVERQWALWADEHGVEMDRIRELMHGVRGAEVVAAVAPGLDAEAEAAAASTGRRQRTWTGWWRWRERRSWWRPCLAWTVVTSGRHELASARLGFAGCRVPESIVCAEDVERGKPEPDGYLLAASRLGMPPEECVVIEDAPPGVAAARAAGMRVGRRRDNARAERACRGRRGPVTKGGPGGRRGHRCRCLNGCGGYSRPKVFSLRKFRGAGPPRPGRSGRPPAPRSAARRPRSSGRRPARAPGRAPLRASSAARAARGGWPG